MPDLIDGDTSLAISVDSAIELIPRGKGPALPPDWGDLTPGSFQVNQPDWAPPELVAAREELAEFRKARSRPPRTIPGMIREEDQ